MGFGSRLTDMFISSLNGVAKGIGGDIKQQLVRPLCDFNFDMSNREYPDPVCLDLEQVDTDALIETLSKLTGTVLTPQDDDEEVLRKILGLPPMKGSAKGRRDQAPAGGPPAGPPAPGVPGNGGGPPGMGLPGMAPGNGGGVMPSANPFGSAGEPKVGVVPPGPAITG